MQRLPPGLDAVKPDSLLKRMRCIPQPEKAWKAFALSQHASRHRSVASELAMVLQLLFQAQKAQHAAKQHATAVEQAAASQATAAQAAADLATAQAAAA